MAVLDWEPVQAAIATVDADAESVEYTNLEASEHLTNQISQVLESTSGGILDILWGAVEALGELASGLLGSLATTEDFWGGLPAKFAEVYPDKVLSFGNFIAKLFPMLTNLLSAELNFRVERLRQDIAAVMESGGDRPIDPTDLTRAIGSLPAWAQNVIGIALAAAAGYNYIIATNAGPLSATEQASMARYLPTPLGLGQLTELLKRQEIGAAWAKQQAARLGISGELFDLAMKGEQQRLTPDHYITAWLRTDSEAHIDEIRKQGLSDDDIGRLKYLAFAEPTPSDIVRFLVRDAYDEQAVIDNKYDEDFDRKYKQDKFDRVGVSKELAQYYWRAHWQLPSPTQGYEMLHRKLIDETQLRELLKIADYAPGWVDHLMNSAYLQPGRIDLRRMWEVGIITDRADLVLRYEKLGYNSADADTLASFSIALAERTKANEAERKRRPIAAQIVRSYTQGTLDRDAAHAAILAVGFSEEDAASYLAEADYGRERDRADRIRDAVGRQYVRGAITEQDASAKLQGYGFLDAEISTMLDSWRLDRELRDWTEAEQHERDLSRADIVAAFENAILAPADAYSSLVALGYDEQEADTILELSAAKIARADAKAEQDAIRVQYINRRIDEGEARNRLDAIAIPASRRDAMLARWTVERDERAPDMPVSWLERLIFHAEISEDDARGELERRGYSPQEVDWTMRLWGADVSIARERLEQQRTQFQQTLEQRAQLQAQRLSVQERALELRNRQATTAQLLQQERFERTLQQREALQTQRLDAAAQARIESASLQAMRDAEQFTRQKELQTTALQGQVDRLQRQIEAANTRQEDAQRHQTELQQSRERLSLQLAGIQDARQQRSIEAQAARLDRQISAADARAKQANDLRAQLQQSQQAFQDQQRQAREAAAAATRVAQEAARIRQESRQESSRIRQEERGAARRTIERAESAVQQESLRSLQLQRDAAIAELNAQLAALEATSAEERISRAEEQQRVAQEALVRLTGPALVFEPAL